MVADRVEVLIVGGGIAGSAVASRLAPDHAVHLIERDRIAGEATGHASGLVSIAADYAATPDLARYALASFERDGEAFGYTQRANVGLVRQEEVTDVRAREDRLRDADLDVEYLDVKRLEERFPGVFALDAFVGGVVFPGGWVDPSQLCLGYLAAARDNGTEVTTGVAVERLLVEDGAVVGVETSAGRIRASTVVVAAGWRSRKLVAPVAELPLRPFRYQTVNLAVDRDLGSSYPIAWEHETRLYWRPEANGELHVGGGTYFTDGSSRRTTVTESFRELVADVVPTRLRGLGDPRIVGEACCPTGDAATPDEYPIVDQPVDGLVVATGLTGFGIMASPVVGRAVRSLVTGERAPFPLAPLRLDRFDVRGTAFTLPYVAEDPTELRP